MSFVPEMSFITALLQSHTNATGGGVGITSAWAQEQGHNRRKGGGTPLLLLGDPLWIANVFSSLQQQFPLLVRGVHIFK